MRSSSRSARGRLPLLIVLATMLVVSLATVVQAHADPTEVMPQSAPSASGGVAEPTGGDTTVSGTPAAAEPSGDGAQHVEPGTPVKDPRPVAIDHITVAGDGTTATVYYWGGTDTCYALASVDVKTGANGVPTITVYQGTLASLPADQPCIEIAVLYATTITLEQPLFIDGAQAGPGA